MNTSHYPSLDLCKKLTEAGFPRTENSVSTIPGQYFCTCDTTKDLGMSFCPSVMELLDVLPAEITTEIPVFFSMDKCNDGFYMACYTDNGLQRGSQIFKRDTLPNALAEMVIWLVENNYISFK